MKIFIDDAIIDVSGFQSYNCPIAHALVNAGALNVRVFSGYCRFTYNGVQYTLEHTEAISSFIYKWDNDYLSVSNLPIEFELDLSYNLS